VELFFTSLLVFFLPTQFGLHFWPLFAKISGVSIDYLSPTFLITDLLIIPLLVNYLIRLKKFPKIHLIIILLIILFLINIIFSLNPLNSIFKFLRLLEYLLLVITFLSRPKYLLHSLINIFPFSLILINSLTWLQFYYQHSLNGPWYFFGERFFSLSTPGIAKINLYSLGEFLRPYSTFSHPNSLSGFLLVSALILYFFYRRGSHRFTVIAIVFTMLTVPLTFSRTAIILEIVVLLILYVKNIYFYLLIIPIFIIMFMSGNPASFTERISLAKVSIHQTELHPLTGIGLGNFPLVSPAYQPVHSLPLLLITELGIPTCILIGILLCKIAKLHLQLPREITTAWLVIIISGLVDHYWLTSSQNLLLVVILATLTIHISRQTG
jgi:hypothetical protein